MRRTFKATPGARLTDEQAQRVGPILVKLVRGAGEDGGAEAVLRAAESRSSPLHEFFEWDDTEAAHQHRLEQARRLLRSVQYVVTDRRGDEQRVRAIEYVPGAGYVEHTDVARSEDLSRALVGRFRSDLEALLGRWRSYRHVPEFAAIVDELDVFARRVARTEDLKETG